MAYKYTHPADWLLKKIDRYVADNDIDQLQGLAKELVTYLDGDTIQDHFQSEMDADGYFDEVEE
jgi:hypothetical protein